MVFIKRRRKAGSAQFSVSVHGGAVEIARLPKGASRPLPHAWSDAEILSRLLRGILDQGATTVVIDLEGGDATTSLLAVLIDARGHARRSGARVVVHGSPAIRELARICRIERVLFT